MFEAALAPDEVGCRFGGDEFAFLIPGADAQRAAERCRALAALVAERTFLERQGICVRLRASFGWAAYPEDATTAKALLHVADGRMYESKRARGRARGT